MDKKYFDNKISKGEGGVHLVKLGHVIINVLGILTGEKTFQAQFPLHNLLVFWVVWLSENIIII